MIIVLYIFSALLVIVSLIFNVVLVILFQQSSAIIKRIDNAIKRNGVKLHKYDSKAVLLKNISKDIDGFYTKYGFNSVAKKM